MLARMGLFIDSFWRAVGYCLMPRVIALSLLPLVLITVVALGGGYLFWTTAVAWTQTALESSTWLGLLWGWLHNFGVDNLPVALAPLLVLMGATPLIVIVCVLAVAVLMAPAIVTLVAQRRFAQLQRKRGGSFLASVLWSLGSTIAALIALVLSMPLWLVPPLVLILPPLIWGWLTYRVMAFDALAEHASKPERQEIFKRHQLSLLSIGVLSGFLGAAPGIVWASGVVFAAAFFVLVPVAIWIYTLVFAFSSLWFTHFCLAALQQLREQRGERPPGDTPATAAPATPASSLPSSSHLQDNP
ncbi:EI24 domain-containing protein [Diaphorobacter sp. DS2]|nr:EI24 domain-containing protein [Diaphorobacter sp. DS2]